MRRYTTIEDDSLDMICHSMNGDALSIEAILSLNPILAQYDIGHLPKNINIIFEDIESNKEKTIKTTVSLWD